MEKCLKPIQNTEKENVNLATQVNQHYVASQSLAVVNLKLPNTATIQYISQAQL